MLIRDAVQLLASATLSSSRRVALVCSFEPLHLRTYLQAFLIESVPEETPEVVVFGYDQMPAAMAATASTLKTSPALLCLSWHDIHPALSWRTRARGVPELDELTREGARLHARLTEWIAARRGADTYVVAPPADFLPFLDACSPDAMGARTLAASSIMATLTADLALAGARVLRVPSFDLNYRDLLLSGSPLSAEHAERIAATYVGLAVRATPRKKAIVTDLDGTLWHGVIGEDGPGALACGPEGKGYPFFVFQQFLLKLKAEGVLLAFCSKNNADDVLPLFDALDMPLKLSDFSAFRCDWEPKSAGIRAIARELNIGDDALVVVDDDPAELEEIRRGVGGAVLFETPRDARQWRDLLRQMQEQCATWTVSGEDRIRAAAIASERERSAAQTIDRGTGARDSRSGELSHLRDLNLHVTIQEAAFDDPRSLELVNRTNQFNLTGERFASDQWLEWAATPGAFCWSARLTDRFGDFGTICVVTGRADGPTLRLRQFVVSCRALGRGVETIVLGELIGRHASQQMRGPFTSTGKNEPARTFLARLGCVVGAGGEWRVDGAAVLQASRTVLEQTRATSQTAAAPGLKTPA